VERSLNFQDRCHAPPSLRLTFVFTTGNIFQIEQLSNLEQSQMHERHQIEQEMQQEEEKSK